MKKIFSFCCIVFFLFSISCFTALANNDIVIDVSKKSNGLVSVQYKGNFKKAVKVQIENADKKYNYTLDNNNITNFPLQLGSGKYRLTVLENVAGTKYKVLQAESFDVGNLDDRQVYKNSIQLVNFSPDMKSIVAANSLTSTAKTEKEKLDIVYDYIISNLSYDFEKLNQLDGNYIPVIDVVYASKKGICYDYASLFASALRNLGIPTKLQMGYFTEVKEYHAWNQIYLDGVWLNIDTTYDSQAKAYKVEFSQVKDNSQFIVVKQY